MSAATDIQLLIRFLTQSANVPLAIALQLAKPLHASSQTPSSLAAITPKKLQELLGASDADGKLSKQVSSAAKRVAKKRASADSDNPISSKKSKTNDKQAKQASCPALPEPLQDVDTIKEKVIYTNRAPLMLAFTVTMLKYTTSQPEDSRLSLGMAVVSAGAKAKARDLGINTGARFDAVESLGKGHRALKILGRDVPVLKRENNSNIEEAQSKDQEHRESANETTASNDALSKSDWYWGLDIEALHDSKAATALPIHTPQSAHAYLIKAFPSADGVAIDQPKNSDTGKLSCGAGKFKAVAEAEDKLANLQLLLGAIDMLFSSWSSILGPDELDSRAWSWYAKVRPSVEHGRSGWGGKGEVRLEEILKMRREGG